MRHHTRIIHHAPRTDAHQIRFREHETGPSVCKERHVISYLCAQCAKVENKPVRAREHAEDSMAAEAVSAETLEGEVQLPGLAIGRTVPVVVAWLAAAEEMPFCGDEEGCCEGGGEGVEDADEDGKEEVEGGGVEPGAEAEVGVVCAEEKGDDLHGAEGGDVPKDGDEDRDARGVGDDCRQGVDSVGGLVEVEGSAKGRGGGNFIIVILSGSVLCCSFVGTLLRLRLDGLLLYRNKNRIQLLVWIWTLGRRSSCIYWYFLAQTDSIAILRSHVDAPIRIRLVPPRQRARAHGGVLPDIDTRQEHNPISNHGAIPDPNNLRAGAIRRDYVRPRAKHDIVANIKQVVVANRRTRTRPVDALADASAQQPDSRRGALVVLAHELCHFVQTLGGEERLHKGHAPLFDVAPALCWGGFLDAEEGVKEVLEDEGAAEEDKGAGDGAQKECEVVVAYAAGAGKPLYCGLVSLSRGQETDDDIQRSRRRYTDTYGSCKPLVCRQQARLGPAQANRETRGLKVKLASPMKSNMKISESALGKGRGNLFKSQEREPRLESPEANL